MIRTINRLNEEISRWAFEIIFKTNDEWQIAFTNPTAGPWKTIKTKAINTNNVGEVYRFALEEDRPDIILFNDKLKTVIIFEAKDSLAKLTDAKQAKKSANVVIKLGEILSLKGDNEFWRGRENYNVILGLLWGSVETKESSATKQALYDQYHSMIRNSKHICDNIIIGIETLYKDGGLVCYADFKAYNTKDEFLAQAIVSSLIQ